VVGIFNLAYYLQVRLWGKGHGMFVWILDCLKELFRKSTLAYFATAPVTKKKVLKRLANEVKCNKKNSLTRISS
jgi:hypothetical protein